MLLLIFTVWRLRIGWFGIFSLNVTLGWAIIGCPRVGWIGWFGIFSINVTLGWAIIGCPRVGWIGWFGIFSINVTLGWAIIGCPRVGCPDRSVFWTTLNGILLEG